jgi:transcriptional accessory protein Tex/SPT6
MNKSNNTLEKKKQDLILSDTEQNTLLENLVAGNLVIEEARRLKIKLKTLYDFVETNPKFKEQFLKAQEIGIKTLVELLLEAFNQDHQEVDANKLLFLRERSNYIRWLAPRVSNFFQEKKNLDIKSDGVLRVMWEDTTTEQDIIDITNEIESKNPIPLDNKGTD